jgi:hypothetical protein
MKNKDKNNKRHGIIHNFIKTKINQLHGIINETIKTIKNNKRYGIMKK